MKIAMLRELLSTNNDSALGIILCSSLVRVDVEMFRILRVL
jgi:hypothetical protein